MKLSQASMLTILGLLAFGAFLLTVPIASVSADDGLFRDVDKDGFFDAADGGDDCDDTDPTVHPGAREISNGIDDDCDNVLTKGDILIQRGVPGKGLRHAKGTVKFFNATKGFGF